MKVAIREWHAVATWHWDIAQSGGDELCGICRVPFDGTCPNCKYPGDTCPLILGQGCTHNFHLHCILKWLEQDSSKGLCPMCRQTFTAQERLGIGSKAELDELQKLVDGHRNRVDQGGDEEFEAFEE